MEEHEHRYIRRLITVNLVIHHKLYDYYYFMDPHILHGILMHQELAKGQRDDTQVHM